MGTLVRLWEKLTFRPHRQETAERVTAAAAEFSESARALSEQLQPYVESDDPLTAMMMDLYARRRKGASHASPESRS